MTNVTNNPQCPFIGTDVFVPDQLVAGNLKLVTDSVTIGAGTLVRGTVLGQITSGAATSAAKSGGNTGNGTLTLDATTPKLTGAQVGVYTVRCINAAFNGGTFRVTAPDGDVIGDVAVGSTFSNQIKFAIADGAPDFNVGDGFDITVAAGSGYYIQSVKTAVNGSNVPVAILADATDASGGVKVGGIYLMGEFNQGKLTYSNTFTLAELKTLLRPLGIFLKTSVSASASY